MMTSREWVLTALKCKEPDRVPSAALSLDAVSYFIMPGNVKIYMIPKEKNNELY